MNVMIPVKFNLVGTQHSATIEKKLLRKRGQSSSARLKFLSWRSSKRFRKLFRMFFYNHAE